MAKQRKGKLYPKEIMETAKKAKTGGFSVRTTGRFPDKPGGQRTGRGKGVLDRFAVGFAPEAGREEEVGIDPSKSVARQIYNFNVQKQDVLSTRGAEMGIGGWEEEGEVKQDVSTFLPRTAEGFQAAMQIGSYGNQYSIGVLGKDPKDAYEGEIVIPKHLHKDQFGPSELKWHDDPDKPYEPKTESAGTIMATNRMGDVVKRNVVRITPSRMEMVDVEAQEMARKRGLS